MNDTSIEMIIKAQDEASAKIKEIQQQLGNMSGAAEKSGPSFLSMASAVAVGQAAFAGFKWAANEIIGGLKEVVQLAGESEKIMTQTNAVIASTKGVAGMTADSVSDLATKLSSVIPVDDEVVQATENMLLTFTNIHKDIFPKVTETALDMSIALGQDTKASAIQLGKALQDPVAGVTALQRVGVRLSEQQKQQVKDFMATNQIAKAQSVILQELQTEFGGSGRAAGTTFAGQLTILNTQLDNVKENIGKTIITAIQPFIQKLTAWAATDEAQAKIQQISTKIGEMAEAMAKWVTEVAIPWVQQHWPEIKRVVKEVGEGIYAVTKFIWEHKAAFEALIGMIIALKVVSTIQGIVGAFQGLGGAIGLLPAMVAIGIAIDVDLILKAVSAVKDLKKEVGSMDQKTKEAWWSSLSWSEKAAVWVTGAKGFASGTDFVQASGEYWVGEKGPEKVKLPRGAQVTPNDKIGGSQGLVVNIYGNVNNQAGYTPEEIGKIINRQIVLVRQGAF